MVLWTLERVAFALETVRSLSRNPLVPIAVVMAFIVTPATLGASGGAGLCIYPTCGCDWLIVHNLIWPFGCQHNYPMWSADCFNHNELSCWHLDTE